MARRRLLLVVSLLACAAGVRAEQLPLKVYTTTDGLPRNQSTAITRDSRGFLWFVTPAGVSRFDGQTFTNFGTERGLPPRGVNRVYETKNGLIWIATTQGLFLVDREERRPGAPFPQFPPRGALPIGSVLALVEDRSGTLWVGTWRGLFRMEKHGDGWSFRDETRILGHRRPEEPRVRALLDDRAGTLWIAAGDLYRRWPDGAIERFPEADGLTNIHQLREDSRGTIWGARDDNGVCAIAREPRPGGHSVVRNFHVADGLISENVLDMLPTPDGRVWLAHSGGVSVHEPGGVGHGAEFRRLTRAQGLPHPEIDALATDGEGNIWMGTQTSGVVKLARNSFTTFGAAEGLTEVGTNDVFEDSRGDVVLVTAPRPTQLHRFDGHRFVRIDPRVPAGLTLSSTWGRKQVVQDPAGEWWIVAGAALCRYPRVKRIDDLAQVLPRAVYTTRDGLPGDPIFALFADRRGDIWISTIATGGNAPLYRWERSTGKFRSLAGAGGGPGDGITAFGEDGSGDVWLGFFRGRLMRVSGDRFEVFGGADVGLPGIVWSFHLDTKGRLWAATEGGGAVRIDDPGAPHPRITRYTVAEGLACNDLHDVTEDAFGRIYFGTQLGVDRLDPETGRVKHFAQADGLPNLHVWAACRDRRGALFFATNAGLSRLVPEPDRPAAPPDVLVHALRVSGVPQPISPLGETEMARLDLSPDQHQVEVEFSALSFAVGEDLRYQYRLVGGVATWSQPSRDRSVLFANLAPGRYRFEVRAINADGELSPRPATVSFTIEAPVWKRAWFVGLSATLLAGLAYAVHRQRVRRLLQVQLIRNRIARDLHDDVGASLSQVAVMTEVVRRRVDGDPLVGEPLEQIAGTARELVESMSDIVWAINPKRDRLPDLAQRMRRFAGDTFAASGIKLRFAASGAEQDLKLDAEVRRQVLLIFKEAVNNAARHSGCGLVEIEFRVERGRLELRVSDDGRGFDVTGDADGHGLASMRERAWRLGGDVTISSADGAGTTVLLSVPLGRRPFFRKHGFPPERVGTRPPSKQ